MSARAAVADARPRPAHRIDLGPEAFEPDPSGALWHGASRTLVVADLHLAKSSAAAHRGLLLPPYDTRATLAALAAAVAARDPARVVALGDSFHDRHAPARLDAEEAGAIRAMQAGRAWLWVRGNHDPDPPAGLGGTAAASVGIGPVVLRHEPSGGRLLTGTHEVAGHLHPCAVLRLGGRRLRRRCFASDGTRAVLPAFGAFAGGLEVTDPALATLFDPARLALHALGTDRVYRVAGPRGP